MRPVDADALKKHAIFLHGFGKYKYVPLKVIDAAPTIDLVHAAGGCYCRECRWGQEDDIGVMHCHKFHIHKKPGGYCDDGIPKEA